MGFLISMPTLNAPNQFKATCLQFCYLFEKEVLPGKFLQYIMFQVAESLQVLGLFDPNKKTNKSNNHKKCENSSKKRNRLLNTVEGEDSRSSRGTTPLPELDEFRTAESSMDIMVDPTDWLEINDQSCNRNSVDSIQGSSSESRFRGTNNSVSQNKNLINMPPKAEI